ncbi:MAG: hypothetical protein NC407_13480 [Lachnoclostridium sp.]|nr:hypothetical protein [Lachnoclostridium sp.]
MKRILSICIIMALLSNAQVAKEYFEEETNISQKETDIENSEPKLSDENLEQIKSEADSFLSASVVSDFLAMDSEDFENKYDRNQLYEDSILYCDMAAWRFHGYYGMEIDWEDCYDYFNIINITALRYIAAGSLYNFVEENHTDKDSLVDSNPTTGVYIQHMGVYAISIYFQRDMDTQKEDLVKVLEISFVKMELREGVGTAPETLYQLLEDDYYDGRERILSEDWMISPGGNKEVCVLNGGLTKSPAQIFIRYQDKRPDTVFRFEWEQGAVGWIDNEHVVCYTMDVKPKLIHLETNQIEEIEIPVGDNGWWDVAFDAYGAHYEIKGNHLIARYESEELYRWDIVKKNNEVYIIPQSPESPNNQTQCFL